MGVDSAMRGNFPPEPTLIGGRAPHSAYQRFPSVLGNNRVLSGSRLLPVLRQTWQAVPRIAYTTARGQ